MNASDFEELKKSLRQGEDLPRGIFAQLDAGQTEEIVRIVRTETGYTHREPPPPDFSEPKQ